MDAVKPHRTGPQCCAIARQRVQSVLPRSLRPCSIRFSHAGRGCGRGCVLQSRRPAATTIRPSPTSLPPRSNSCTPHRWCTTICRALMMPRHGAGCRAFTGLRRTSRGACGRCTDRAGVPKSRAPRQCAQRMSALLLIVSRSVGTPAGIVAGQAWECEPRVDLAHYHRAKTGSLFCGSDMCRCSGGWRRSRSLAVARRNAG